MLLPRHIRMRAHYGVVPAHSHPVAIDVGAGQNQNRAIIPEHHNYRAKTKIVRAPRNTKPLPKGIEENKKQTYCIKQIELCGFSLYIRDKKSNK